MLIILLTDLAVLSNIPFLRLVFGSLFLTILPGLLLLQILKLDKIGCTEKFVLSVGISISFLMFFGLLINSLSLIVGYLTPLSTISLLIMFNFAFIVLGIAGYKVNKTPILSIPNFNLNASEKIFLIVPIFFPALSIFGMYVMNAAGNNIILMFMLFLIPIYVACVCFFNHNFSNRLYPVVIFLISISLLLMLALRSNHLIGVDTHSEYYFFQTTLENFHWSVFGHTTLDACLAISLLPAIYQSILDASPEFVFKILYSLLFSISPLAVYVISKKYVGELYGFLASCFFMSQHNFLLTELHARTNTAILFFALAMMVLFSDKIDPLKKRFLFIVFMASCMVSHYSTTYLFFFILLGTFIGLEILSKKYSFKKIINSKVIILFFVMIFFWYSQVTEAAFADGVNFIADTLSSLQGFFVEESRSDVTQSMLGSNIGEKGIPHKIEFVFTWLTFAFIGIGIITSLLKHKEMSFSELNFEKSEFLRNKFEVGYFVVALICSGLFVAVVLFPHITTGYSLDRAYLFGIVVLSTFFVIGGITLSKSLSLGKKGLLKKRKETIPVLNLRAYLVILLVLIPYFFSVTGATYQLFGYPRAITLNSEGTQCDMYYIHDQDSYGAKWLSNYAGREGIKVFTDYRGRFVLISQGMFPRKYVINNEALVVEDRMIKGYIYLRHYTVVGGKLSDKQSGEHNITEYSDKFIGKGKIYNNGGGEIWK